MTTTYNLKIEIKSHPKVKESRGHSESLLNSLKEQANNVINSLSDREDWKEPENWEDDRVVWIRENKIKDKIFIYKTDLH